MKAFALTVSVCATLAGLASPALADLQKVTSRDAFVALVDGKTLTRPLVRLQVLPNGQITGKGATWKISGKWVWKDGYLCRSLNWGGDDLGYNCQEIKSDGSRMRFTSDRGSGDSAEFNLR
ncbi:dihydrodipicolinate reductase [Sulfitobacter sp. M57]|uniref:dihydrodipicolinate reductase n=1 Tax=unclassified Sulfitobacter TaxID=196795 RepID=UPI0023E34674|nr:MULTISPECIES: dihydrodipicolinate reductase [unclassified Sulfitobacter]MDF3415382.1 dihydrodipicolinate reductase [Sulfitobacter sp. KE5]MDF3422863.1 dihydrodipicolinate reductase [Sulfitobacter sp. KE43]MDF3433928.1 dihydrodipicolinate reductase [Sulfitobacter sp. KE42]MDF3459568.1 dihydrodipicolinate reductase [Sulfitobacter sp. S74]MDF3463467.1 dihydrodipicolinate reductase [Sulfitobacter sp. Ks18]